MKKLFTTSLTIVFIFAASHTFAFSFRGLLMDRPIDSQMKLCGSDAKDICYVKKGDGEYEIKNLPELSFQTNTTVKTYGDDNKIGKITVTFPGKDATSFFSLLMDKYGPPKATRGKIHKRVIQDRNTGNRTVVQTPSWILDDCYLILADIDEDNRDNGILKVISKTYMKLPSDKSSGDKDKL